MKAKQSNDFPIFKITTADECPVCLSVLISFDGKNALCPSCAGRVIKELRKMIKEALPIIRRDADEDGHHYSEAAAKWLQKYNEVTQ